MGPFLKVVSLKKRKGKGIGKEWNGKVFCLLDEKKSIEEKIRVVTPSKRPSAI